MKIQQEYQASYSSKGRRQVTWIRPDNLKERASLDILKEHLDLKGVQCDWVGIDRDYLLVHI